MRTQNQRNLDFFQKEIKSYLDKRAETDKQFAVTYAKENKNIVDCCNYILQQVEESGRCGFADDEIYSMAVHYYDEDNIETKKMSCPKVVVNRKIELSESQKIILRRKAEDEYLAKVREEIAEREKKKAEAEAERKAKKAEAEKAMMSNDLFGGL